MLPGRQALRELYAKALKSNSIQAILDEMLDRGLPRSIYNKYLEEAIDKGLIPIPGKSKIGNKIVTEKDILKAEDILEDFIEDFTDDRSWYGIG